MSRLATLKKHSVMNKLPMINVKRGLYSALFFILFIPAFALISNLVNWDTLFMGAAVKYVAYIFVLSLLYIVSYFILASLRAKAYFTILYRGYFLLTEICILGISHIYYLRTDSLYFYIIALIYLSVVPLFSLRELNVSIILCALAIVSFVVPYSLGSSMLFQLVCTNVLMCMLTLCKYHTSIDKLNVSSRLHNELNRSTKDPLTGLLNRRGLERKVNVTWPICMRHNISTAIIMLDIDFFKKYNDRFGHPQGDKCIREIAKVIATTARRSTDISSRIGGEEFMVFVQDIRKEDLLVLAKRIQRGVEALEMPHATRELSDYVTVSIGIAYTIPSETNDFNYLYQKADSELYHAKESGRNCISMDGSIFSKSPARTSAKYDTPYGQIYNRTYRAAK